MNSVRLFKSYQVILIFMIFTQWNSFEKIQGQTSIHEKNGDRNRAINLTPFLHLPYSLAN
jgi:hypothetical protein